MKELSVFIDESGDFGETRDVRDYYLVTFVFHDQSKDITEDTKKLEQSMKDSGWNIEYIHTGPVIRRENGFTEYSIDERRSLIYKMLNFVIKCPINFCTVAIKRKEATNKVQLSGKLGKAINQMLTDHMDYISKFDKVIVYYDNGQNELGALLNAIFSIQISNVEFRNAEQQKYRLLQAADFFCSIDLLKIKRAEGRLSRSETQFFYKPNELKKTFIKGIDKKRI
ncbi:MAG: hypothetical protein E7273_03315 [Pseudobutyrivibrio ruminis]|nr:hypothetical protein [Pseudobutyrivibrio ruminis]